ncbi:MAG: tRNA (adenosine(37)-N6)-threonylcarbamoyltransferase complex ATPase subunit type 1 TsaE [Ghiorsea sp.]
MRSHIQNEAAMIGLAQTLATDIHEGDCLALHGDLGAGKSFLSRAIMRALGVADEALPSPTFAIIQEYDANHDMKVAHMDWYRLDDGQSVEQLGVSEFFSPPWVTLIEWSERASELLPKHTKHIYIELDDKDMNARFVRIE